MVPDPDKSLEQGAVLPWRRGGKRMVVYYKGLLRGVAKHYQQSMEVPYKDLPEDFKRVLLWGSGEIEIEFNFWRAGKLSKVTRSFEGVIPNLRRLYQESESEFTRNRLKGFMSPQFCDACEGRRLKPEILSVTLGDAEAHQNFKAPSESGSSRIERRPCTPRHGAAPAVAAPAQRLTFHVSRFTLPGLSIMDVCGLSVQRADEFFATPKLTEFQEKVAHDLIKEIRARLGFLKNVGLGYLTLDRESGTLSGGEAQRIRLATQIGAGLVGVLYVLDEPSIGLHQRDNDACSARWTACATSAIPCWSSSTTTRPSARPTTSSTSAPVPAPTAANLLPRARWRNCSRIPTPSPRNTFAASSPSPSPATAQTLSGPGLARSARRAREQPQKH